MKNIKFSIRSYLIKKTKMKRDRERDGESVREKEKQ